MGRTKVRASGHVAGLASVRLTMSTYHVDLPKSTITIPRPYWGCARNGFSLKNVQPGSSTSVLVADAALRLGAAAGGTNAQPRPPLSGLFLVRGDLEKTSTRTTRNFPPPQFFPLPPAARRPPPPPPPGRP